MRQLEGDDADLAVRSPGGVPQVSGAHHPDSGVPAVVAVAVRRVPRPGVAPQAVVGLAGHVHGGRGGVVGERPRWVHRGRPVAQLADKTEAARDSRRGRPVAVGGHRQDGPRATDDKWRRSQWRRTAVQLCRLGRRVRY